MPNPVPTELIAMTLKYSTPGRSMTDTPLSGLRVARSDQPTVPIYRVYAPSLCFIVQGEKDSIVGGKTYRYGPAHYLVNSVSVPVTGQIVKASLKQPYLCLVLEIEAEVVSEIVRQTETKAQSSTGTGRAVFIEKSSADITDAVLRLVRTLRSDGEREVLAPLIKKEIFFRLLQSRYGQSVRQVGVEGSRLHRVSSAIETIRRNFSKALNMNALAKAANMSPSTFHRHFKQATAMSPLQYQKQLRLQEARRLLIDEVTDVATAGFRVGYESPSQFSREYSRMFGLSPSRDMQRLRE